MTVSWDIFAALIGLSCLGCSSGSDDRLGELSSNDQPSSSIGQGGNGSPVLEAGGPEPVVAPEVPDSLFGDSECPLVWPGPPEACAASEWCVPFAGAGVAVCLGSGSVLPRDPCVSQRDCVEGSLCEGEPKTCEPLCKGDDECQDDEVCVSFYSGSVELDFGRCVATREGPCCGNLETECVCYEPCVFRSLADTACNVAPTAVCCVRSVEQETGFPTCSCLSTLNERYVDCQDFAVRQTSARGVSVEAVDTCP